MRRMEYLRTDPNVSFDDQLNSDHQGPVILISLYSAPEEQMDALLKGWTERAEMMLKQPGLISVQMHRGIAGASILRSEEHTSELQSLMRISYAVFCLKKKNNKKKSD